MDHPGSPPTLLISQIIGHTRTLHFGDHRVEVTLSRDIHHGTRVLQIDHLSIREDTKGGVGGTSTGMTDPVHHAYMKGEATVEELRLSRERRLAVEHIYSSVRGGSFQELIDRITSALDPAPSARRRIWMRDRASTRR